MIKTFRAATAIAGVAATALGAVLLFAGSAAASPPGPTGHKVTICHRTDSNTNPYVEETVDVASILKKSGHASHTGPVWNSDLKKNHIEWGDIIPKFTYEENGTSHTFLGYNNGTVGQGFLANNCQIPSAPSSSTTSSSTTESTTTSSSTETTTTSSSSESTTTSTSTQTTTPSTTVMSTTTTTPPSTTVVSTTQPASSSTQPPASTSLSIQVLPTSRSVTPAAATSSSVSIQVLAESSSIAPTSPAPSATAHTGQPFGIAGALLLGGGVVLLLSSWWLRRGHGARG